MDWLDRKHINKYLYFLKRVGLIGVKSPTKSILSHNIKKGLISNLN